MPTYRLQASKLRDIRVNINDASVKAINHYWLLVLLLRLRLLGLLFSPCCRVNNTRRLTVGSVASASLPQIL